MENVEIGKPYIGNWKEKNCAIVFDYAADGGLIGRLYLDKGLLTVEPVAITANLNKKGKGSLLVGGREIKLKKVQIKNGYLKGSADGGSFTLKSQGDGGELFKPQYMEPCYEKTTDTVVTFARAEGYWTSYPDENKSFAEIYLARVSDLSKKEELPLCMDIYLPVDSSTNLRPLVLMIHGGAFFNGDMQDEPYVKWCRHYASLGYVAVSLNYRLGWLPYKSAIDRAGYRAAQDANAALRYLLHHAQEYRINPDWVFTWGTSAGAITALNVAYMNDACRPESVIGEGKIDMLAPEYTETFHVRAVANLWGAVHDTAILANSPSTAVISFHGDADGIVPYGYGYPFKAMLTTSMKTDVNGLFNNLIHYFSPSSGGISGLIDWGASLLNPIVGKIAEWGEPLTNPVWDLVVSPTYGSACIHEYLTNHNIRNKLFTAEGRGHSLHVDDDHNIVDTFYIIQDSVARFFYTEIVSKPVSLRQESSQSQYFCIDNDDVAEIHWIVDGGAVIETSDNRSKVIFFKDAEHHAVRVTGKYTNGVEFCETLEVL